MDLNMEFAAHQKELMSANSAGNDLDRQVHLNNASDIARRINMFQRGLGAAASCAWSVSQHSARQGI